MDAAHYRELLADLAAETAQLDTLMAGWTDLDRTLAITTPAQGWNIHDQLVHLAFFDDVAVTAADEPDRFRALVKDLLADSAADSTEWIDRICSVRAGLSGGELLRWWTSARQNLLSLFGSLPPATRMPWFGPPMSAASAVTARMMETWAHAQDIHDAVGSEHPESLRVRHVCHLGVITRSFAHRNRGLDVPEAPVRVELRAVDGSTLAWGPPEAVDRITGDATEFALIVTQRRHPDATGVRASVGPAQQWLQIAQAFAGAPGPGRPTPAPRD